jgi:hypothetical protein
MYLGHYKHSPGLLNKVPGTLHTHPRAVKQGTWDITHTAQGCKQDTWNITHTAKDCNESRHLVHHIHSPGIYYNIPVHRTGLSLYLMNIFARCPEILEG